MDHRTIVSFFTCQLVWVNRYLASAKEDCEISLQEAVKAQEEATQARVEVARLEGHLTSLTKQNVDLIAALSGKAPHSS